METIDCKTCNESWDEETAGYGEALRTLNATCFRFCPACRDKLVRERWSAKNRKRLAKNRKMQPSLSTKAKGE